MAGSEKKHCRDKMGQTVTLPRTMRKTASSQTKAMQTEHNGTNASDFLLAQAQNRQGESRAKEPNFISFIPYL